MHPISDAQLLAQLRWRYAAKKFDPARKIAPDLWDSLEQALVLSPSSFGLQPWRFIVVTDAATKVRLRAQSRNQPQVEDSSHLVVFATSAPIDETFVDSFVRRSAEVREVPVAELQPLGDRIRDTWTKGPQRDRFPLWAANQVHIALGNFLTSAALLGIDACPMGGIDPDGYDAELGLAPLGIRTVVVAAAGYRATDDKAAQAPKVRFRREDVIIRR